MLTKDILTFLFDLLFTPAETSSLIPYLENNFLTREDLTKSLLHFSQITSLDCNYVNLIWELNRIHNAGMER